MPTREVFLRRAAVVKMAHMSTSIERNMLEEYQVKQIAEGKKIIAQKDQLTEVENYLIALNLVDRLSDKKAMELKDLMALHKVVIGGLVQKHKEGVIRNDSVYIINTDEKGDGKLIHSPPPPDDVRKLLDDLLSWLDKNSQVHPIIRAGLFHYEFETIHPFTDGNGRVGRLATLLHLYQSGWDFKKALVLEDYYNRDRGEYYKHLQTSENYADRKGKDLTRWIEYFVEGFLDEATQVREQVLMLKVSGVKSSSKAYLSPDEVKDNRFCGNNG